MGRPTNRQLRDFIDADVIRDYVEELETENQYLRRKVNAKEAAVDIEIMVLEETTEGINTNSVGPFEIKEGSIQRLDLDSIEVEVSLKDVDLKPEFEEEESLD